MQNLYDVVAHLTSQQTIDPRMLTDFASRLGWQPSDRLDVPSVEGFANAHLVVEHGLENTAVITFLNQSRRFRDLNYEEKNRLLNISYNNLVDWHIQIHLDEVDFVFNRRNPPEIVATYQLTRDNLDQLRSEAFEQIAGKRPNPNIPALDDALIDTISTWKRSLSAELNYSVNNESLSALFNSIIFTRAVEDHGKKFSTGLVSSVPGRDRILLDEWENSSVPLRDVLSQCLRRYITSDIPKQVLDHERLSQFDTLDRQTVYSLLTDFYRTRHAPYEYDFSIISKQALSRIYEHYVSLLRLTNNSPYTTLTLFPRLPEEERNKAYGSVYTPQFVARFFARYLREQMSPSMFKRLKVADPACGSGIFLRTMLEIQCDPTQSNITPEDVRNAFSTTLGIDVDDNACQAAYLSLSLLHLVLTDDLPTSLNILQNEAIGYILEHPREKASCDAVIANPPFVRWEAQSSTMRERIAEYISEYTVGKADAYLAFLRIGLDMLKPGGYGLFVLPQSFLLGRSARKIRKLLAEQTWIRCLADLSAIRVFEDTGVYIILLIFQKKPVLVPALSTLGAPKATIIRCREAVSRALQDAVRGQRTQNNFYSIYDVEQTMFGEEEWILLPPNEASLKEKFERLPMLEGFMHVRQGFVSGADGVFIIPKEQIPTGEEQLYVPYLRDRAMKSYVVPVETEDYFFYPYIGDKKLVEDELRTDFPKTWTYLQGHKQDLLERKTVQSGRYLWWMPAEPRRPDNMMRPKIVSPHLVLTPRFAFDVFGTFAVSHSPLVYPKETAIEGELLRYFVAVLNSTPCYWYTATHSHTYQSNYVRLEIAQLRQVRVPDPRTVSAVQMRNLLDLVDKRLLSTGNEALAVAKEIDLLVSNLYGLDASERKSLGMSN